MRRRRIDEMAGPPAQSIPAPSREELVSHLGEEFLAYVSGATPEEIRTRVSNECSLVSRQREEAFVAALDVASRIITQRGAMSVNGNEVPLPIDESLTEFARVVPAEGLSVANVLRTASGASLPDVDVSDPLKRAVRELARDWFPILLLPEGDDEGSAGPHRSLRKTMVTYGHRAMTRIVQAVRAEDEALRAFFPTEIDADGMASSRTFMASTGQGGSLQLATLVPSLLNAAAFRLQMRSRPLTAASYLNAVDALVDELRALGRGEAVEVPAVIGLGSAQVDENFIAATPWGIVRALTSWHRRNAPPMTSASLILETTYHLAIDFDFDISAAPAAPPRGLIEAHQDLEHRVDKVRLALLLALDLEQPVGLMQTWRVTADPLSAGLAVSWSVAQPVPSAATITAADRSKIEAWANRVEAHHHASLDLAIRRTLSSIASRYDPADGLVDAVIALENLFGTGSSEVGFRLSAALAWLLEEDPARRLERQQAINKLYGLRSKIVHGSEIDQDLLYERRVEASQLAIDALRALFEKFPELIPLKEQRGKHAILQVGLGEAPTNAPVNRATP
jgi:hypothetical protein